MIELNQLHTERDAATRRRPGNRDIVALAIALASIALFVAIGGTVVPSAIQAIAGHGLGPDKMLTSALLLNIALVIFGWRSYAELSREVQERCKAEEQARRLSETDPLTGCLNRRSIGPATDRLIADCEVSGEPIAFMMIDLDNFKQINDFNGHSAGDLILQESARRIAALLPDRSLIARLGGDEFACVIPFDTRRSDRMDQIADAIIAAIALPIQTMGPVVEVTVSLGLTRSDYCMAIKGHPADAQSLLHMADIAMYQAKKQGKNQYFWFEAPMEHELRFRNELENGIRAGIPRGEFVPYYEKQIDLQTGDLVGFEMLARWNSPNMGLISPDIFIPIAEEIGVIAELSECVIAQALQDAKNWDAKLTLSVNISPIQLRDPWFAQKILKMLVEANFPPNRLDIEVTESCLHENIGVVRSLITSLKNQGIQISLDDFGTGYSSLAQLRTLPFDRIKIDRSFVTNLIENKDSATIVRAITSLGQGLGLPMTAEGIETHAVLEELQSLGAFKGQGYLYGRPETAAQTTRKLAAMDMLSTKAASLETAPAATEPKQPRKRRSA